MKSKTSKLDKMGALLEASEKSAPGKSSLKVSEKLNASSSFAERVQAANDLVPEQAPAGGGNMIDEIELSLIDENPYNARKIYLPNAIRDRATSMAKDGQLDPVKLVVSFTNPNRYYLVDGHYRVKGAKHLGWKKVKAIILQNVTTPADLFRISWAQNHEREDQSCLDNALAWKQMLDKGVFASEQELADEIGVSRPWVVKTISMASLPQPIIDRISENPAAITISSGYELAVFFRESGDQAATDRLLSIILDDKPGKRALEEIRKSMSRGDKKRLRSRQYKLTQGTIKEWDSGRLVLDIVIGDSESRQKLIDELKGKLENT